MMLIIFKGVVCQSGLLRCGLFFEFFFRLFCFFFFNLVGWLNFFVCLIIWLLFVFLILFFFFFFYFLFCFVLIFPQLKMKLITVTWCFTTELHLQVNISSKCWVQSHLYVF